MQQQELIPHLFRTEFRKIVSVLCKSLGLTHIETAEDIASDTFLSAVETWTYNGIPPNPTAWLYTVAKNKARNYISRDRLFENKISKEIQLANQQHDEIEIDLSDQNITDSQLQMLFAICHPSIPAESQIGFALRILCGFGIDEIANALLTNKDTINKRLFRARERLREEGVAIEFPGNAEINCRVETVLTTLYLFFNEGYYSETQNSVIREELCFEAMQLTQILIENEATNQPPVNALMALMCFHASRFPARKKENGELVLYQDQDQTLWNTDLINKGIYFLHQSATGSTLSKYHLEASIAYWHTIKEDSREKWEQILQLYNNLLAREYSPIAALNRTYALSKTKGKAIAIKEAEKLNLVTNPYYFALLGELYSGIDNHIARQQIQKAIVLVRTEPEKNTLRKKLDAIG